MRLFDIYNKKIKFTKINDIYIHTHTFSLMLQTSDTICADTKLTV